VTELFILPTKTFGGAEVDRLAQIIETGSNTYLRKLSASGHKVPNESLYNLGKAIASSPGALTSLAIGDNSMGHTGVLAFTKGLKEGGGTSQLEEIDWSWKGIGSSGFEMILNSFDSVHCPKLRVLNLRRNEEIAESDGEYSFQSISHLQELDLSQCGLSGDFAVKFFACLQQETASVIKLKKLHLQENPLLANGFKALLPLITSSPLEELNISKCQIDDEAIKNLPTSTPNGTNNLQLLDLSSNGITATGAECLSEGLKSPSSALSQLVELNLAGNQLGGGGVQLLAKALESRQQQLLQKLDLTDTKCGPNGAMDIISKGNLKSLYLFNNNLGSDGFMALVPTLKGGHKTLEHLDLGGNGANQASVVVLLGALVEEGLSEENRLKVLVVGGNEGGDAIEQICARIRDEDATLDIARDKKAQAQPQ